MATGTTSISIELYAVNSVFVYNIDALDAIKTMTPGLIEFFTGKLTNGGKDYVVFSGSYLIKYTERKEA